MLTRLLQLALVLVLVAFALTLALRREAEPVVAERPVAASPAPAPPAAPGKVTPSASIPPASPSPGAVQPVVPGQRRLVVAFRLDPAVTRGLYLGDRWVSPPTFRFAQPGEQYVVLAKLQSIDAHGDRIDLSGNWSSSDPDMLAIDRHDHGQVTLTVRQPGASRLFVSAAGESKVLQVRATRTPDAMDVAITQ